MKPTEGPYKLIWHGNERYPFPLLIRTADDEKWIVCSGCVSSEANARLLAKSWEMREALTSVLRLVDNAKWRDPVGCPLETAPHIEQARALLREIEGESK